MIKKAAEVCRSMYFLFFCFLYLFDTVDLPEKEAQYLWMIEYDYLHHCLLIDHAALYRRRAIQVMINTIAAMIHTALAGNSDATSSPAENAIGTLQFLHLCMIITSLHITQSGVKCYS